MTKLLNREDLDRLMEIKDEIKELVREAENMVHGTPEENRAHSYWAAHIKMALDKDHSYLGGSMCTMEDSINALDPSNEEEVEED